MRPFFLASVIIFFSACAPILIPLTFSVVQVGMAIDEGAASLPYLARSTVGIEEINSRQVNQRLEITIADTYRWAYGKRIEEVPSDGYTGQEFANMRQATESLHKVLAGYGADNPERYVLTSVETTESEGMTLFAAVRRERREFRTERKGDAEKTITVSEKDPAFYTPYRKDAAGRRVDRVIDWAALTTDCYKKQLHQAILLTMEANQIVREQSKPGFWRAREKWRAGDYREVFKTQDVQACAALNIEPGKIEPSQ